MRIPLATRLVYWAGQTLCRVFIGLFGGIRVFGRDNLPVSGSYLICANHSSLLDPPVVGLAFRSRIGYLAKKELFRIPMFGWVLRNLLVVPVDRSRLNKGTLDRIVRMLAAGIPVLVFPEGTRSRTGELGKGKAGLGLLARETAVPLVPAYVHGTRHWPRTWQAAYRISVTFGEPIAATWVAETADHRTGYQQVADRVMREIRMLRDRHATAVATMAAAPAGGDSCERRFYAPTGESQ